MFDYLKDHLWLVWTLITILALILEVSSGTFYIMCFAIGAALATLSSLLAIPFWMQTLLFILFSAISVFAVRPFVMRYVHPKHESRPSNAEALIGREGRVIESITNKADGYVRIDGDEWRAGSSDGKPIEIGTRVRVVARESIVITVERVD